ncbi:NEDD4-binding protein 1 [Salminus brasiliensis]|uniref:NEDD4-binding protein 1 n=1 Tax=Salminus brasiliensis TaxID=930266 RepID=UPI003B82CC15
MKGEARRAEHVSPDHHHLLSCSVMAFSAVPGRVDKMEGEQHVKDEFTCPGVLRGALLDVKATAERVFRVVLRIGGEENSYKTQDGQIWLQLKGRKSDVEGAKLFVKGVVNQEAQEEVQYPEVLHCVFCGAKQFFTDCLIRTTSAHIVVDSSGCLLIFGLTEPVVKAYSLITDLVEKYRNSQEQKTGRADESLDSRRAFKSLVERLEDTYTLDLLVLPVLVKEVLLDLVKQSRSDPSILDSSAVSSSSKTLLEFQENTDRLIVGEPTEKRRPGAQGVYTFLPGSPPSHFSSKSSSYGVKYLSMNKPRGETDIKDHNQESHNQFFHSLIGDLGSRTHAEGAEGTSHKREEQKAFEGGSQSKDEDRQTERLEERLQSTGLKQEFEHLLKFFTAMGYKEDVVVKVLARTGPGEASQLLDLIQHEQEESKIHSSVEAPGQETLHGVTGDAGVGVNGASGTKDDDFVLGVVKKAAASCGYTEDNVAKVYSNFAKQSPHELILGLQKVGMNDPEDARAGERKIAEEMEEQRRKAAAAALQKVRDRDLEVGKSDTRDKKSKSDRGESLPEKAQKKEEAPGMVEPRMRDLFLVPDTKHWCSRPELPSPSEHQPFATIPPTVRGPPQPIYPLQLPPPPLTNVSEQHRMGPVETQATKPKHKQGPPLARTGAVVTGPQRFLEGLKNPFVLQLKDDPGDPGLRQIIIDGSNVAMTHGLGAFFSCRGIALAVQHFWSRGHRKISVFVPQWRQKRDPKIKEHHFMTQLQDLGLLSFTPSREVQGQRINSYDDRFMLQLAQKTNGVIVTNDNMRDLVDESVVWKEIIKERLLQYLFAGDNFMVPDDPLGRSGPHINDFLRAQSRTLIPGSHSFAGVASSYTLPNPQPRAHTEVLNYRERTPGGLGRVQKSGWSQFQGEKEMNRSVEETLKLKHDLEEIFLGQENVVMMMLQCHPALTDINQLSHLILEQQTGTEK